MLVAVHCHRSCGTHGPTVNEGLVEKKKSMKTKQKNIPMVRDAMRLKPCLSCVDQWTNGWWPVRPVVLCGLFVVVVDAYCVSMSCVMMKVGDSKGELHHHAYVTNKKQ